MSTLVATLQGRFGNQAMQWLFCWAFAMHRGLKFECDPWVGERIWRLPPYDRPSRRAFQRVNEITIFDPCLDLSQPYYGDREFIGYAQCQRTMIYTKRQAQSWLVLRPEIEMACGPKCPRGDEVIIAHRRVGDYAGYNYPLVSAHSYYSACREFGLNPHLLTILSEEHPTPHDGLPDDLSFMPDFYRMATASTLLRGNSSFSWLAALLGNGLVLAPVVDGFEGGKEHDCRFVAGNHPKFTGLLDFVSDLYIAP